jgi:hypothetical protein
MIKNIFNAITPDNIKDIPLIKEAITIFIETLIESSSISIDIKDAFKNELMKDEFMKVYLNDIYTILSSMNTKPEIIERIDFINEIYNVGDISKPDYINKDAFLNILGVLNEEYFNTIKSFKEHKGTIASISFIYEMVNGLLINSDEEVPFKLEEIDTFNFKVEGSLPRIIYDEIVRPLAHPIGFVYVYSQVVSQYVKDEFLLEYTYSEVELYVNCYETGKHPYADQVVDIEVDVNYLKITFDNGSYLEEIEELVVFHSVDGLSDISYPENCNIYIDYVAIPHTQVKDETKFQVELNGLHDAYFDYGQVVSIIGDDMLIGDDLLIGGRQVMDEFEITTEITGLPLVGSLVIGSFTVGQIG